MLLNCCDGCDRGSPLGSESRTGPLARAQLKRRLQPMQYTELMKGAVGFQFDCINFKATENYTGLKLSVKLKF